MINKNIKARIVCLILCLAICLAPMTVFAEQAEHVTINILSINDLHGALVGAGYNPGVAKTASVIREEKARNPATLVFAGGDMMQGSYESNELRGAPVIEVLNEIGVNASAVGNHEFDWGMDTLKQVMSSSHFPWLAANIMDKDTGNRSDIWRPYAIFEVKGVKVGVIGLATPGTATTTNPVNIKSFIFKDSVKTVQELLPELKAKGADVVIVISHLDSMMDRMSCQLSGEAVDLAKAVPEIPVIITAHTHQEVCGMVGKTAIIQAASQGRLVAKVTIDYNTKTKTVERITPGIIKVGTQKNDPSVESIVRNTLTKLGPVRNQVVGRLAEPLNRGRSDQSPLGQWVTDNMRTAANADIAFTNPGGLRTNLPEGEITKGMIYGLMPFDNTLYTVDLTGKQIMELLKYGVGNPNKGMLQYSGLIVTYDSDRDVFAEVTLTDGRKLLSDKTYRVVTNDFMAAGGDGYSIFKQGRNGQDTHIKIREVLENAFQGKTINFVPDSRLKVKEVYDRAG